MARHPHHRHCSPRNRSGGRLARLAYKKPAKGRLADVVRLRSDRPGLPSQLREPKWQPDIWEPIPMRGADRRAYEAWTKFNKRRTAAYFFLCKSERPSRRQLRRLKKTPSEPAKPFPKPHQN